MGASQISGNTRDPRRQGDDDRVVVERFRIESQELRSRARACSERLRRIDLALAAGGLAPAAFDALTAERDQLSRAIAGNQARLRALWDSIRFGRPTPRLTQDVPRPSPDSQP